LICGGDAGNPTELGTGSTGYVLLLVIAARPRQLEQAIMVGSKPTMPVFSSGACLTELVAAWSGQDPDFIRPNIIIQVSGKNGAILSPGAAIKFPVYCNIRDLT